MAPQGLWGRASILNNRNVRWLGRKAPSVIGACVRPSIIVTVRGKLLRGVDIRRRCHVSFGSWAEMLIASTSSPVYPRSRPMRGHRGSAALCRKLPSTACGERSSVHFVSPVCLQYLSVSGVENQDQFGAHSMGPRRAALAVLTHVKRRFCVVRARLWTRESNET
jgi:hypothetical protein